MIKVDAVWLAVQPLDMRLGTEAALAMLLLNIVKQGEVRKLLL